MAGGSPSTINWPLAIAISLAVHVAFLGFFFSRSDSSEPKEEPAQEEEIKRSDVQPPEPQVSSNQQAVSAPVAPVTPSPVAPVAPSIASARPAAQSVAPAQPISNTIVYVVAKGDSLTKLAAANCCTVTELAKLNKIKPSSGLRIGQKLKIPAPAEATR